MKYDNDPPTRTNFRGLRKSWSNVVCLFETDGQGLKRKLGAGLFFLLAGILASSAMPILASNIMGPVEYGAFAFLQGVLALASVFSLLGLNSYMVRTFPLLIDEGNTTAVWKLFLTGVVVAVPLSIVLVLLLFYSSDLIQRHTSLYQLIALTPLVVLVYFLSFCLQGIRSSLLGAISRGPLISVLFTFLGILFCTWISEVEINTRNTLWPMLLLYACLVVVLIGIFGYRVAKSTQKSEKSDTNMDSFSRMLKTSFPMLAFASSFFLMSQTDIIVLGYLTDGADISAYVFSSRLALLSSVGLLTANIYLPAIISVLSKNKCVSLLQDLLDVMGVFSNVTFLCLAAVVLLCAGLLADFAGLHGLSWESPLFVLLIGQFVNVYSGSCGYLLTMSGHQNVAAKITMLAALANLVLNLALIPFMGILGAAIATTVSIAGGNLLMAKKAMQLTKSRSFLSIHSVF